MVSSNDVFGLMQSSRCHVRSFSPISDKPDFTHLIKMENITDTFLFNNWTNFLNAYFKSFVNITLSAPVFFSTDDKMGTDETSGPDFLFTLTYCSTTLPQTLKQFSSGVFIDNLMTDKYNVLFILCPLSLKTLRSFENVKLTRPHHPQTWTSMLNI